jgi:hypothetical protein
MRQQLSNPGGITFVSLLARPLLDIVALGHIHFDRFTQDMIHRLPVHACPLHGHHRTLLRLQPSATSNKFTVSGTTVNKLCCDLAIVTNPTETGR